MIAKLINIVNTDFDNITENLIEAYYIYTDAKDFSDLTCTNCWITGQLKRNTKYTRTLIYIKGESTDILKNFEEIYINFENNNANEEDKMTFATLEGDIIITVVKCLSCEKYHSIIPTFIIPYHICSLFIILLSLFLSKSKKFYNEILPKLKISRQLFYFWNKNFKRFIPKASTIFSTGNNDPPEILKLILNDVDNFLKEFYEQYKSTFFSTK